MTNAERIQANNTKLRECLDIAKNLPGVGNVSDGTYKDGYNAGVNSVMTELVDWGITASSDSCTVSIINLHPTFYLHISFSVVWEDSQLGAQENYEDSTVIAPLSSYSFDSEEENLGGQSSIWAFNITEMRFSTDGV